MYRITNWSNKWKQLIDEFVRSIFLCIHNYDDKIFIFSFL